MYSGRDEVLQNWLYKHNARPLWHFPRNEFAITGYSLNGCFFIVQDYFINGKFAGFDIYIPSTKSNDLKASINGVAEFCGVEGINE